MTLTAMEAFHLQLRAMAEAPPAIAEDIQETVVSKLRDYGFLIGATRPGIIQVFVRREPTWMAMAPEYEAEARGLNVMGVQS